MKSKRMNWLTVEGEGGPPTWQKDPEYYCEFLADGIIHVHFDTRNAGPCTNGWGNSRLDLVLPFPVKEIVAFYSAGGNNGFVSSNDFFRLKTRCDTNKLSFVIRDGEELVNANDFTSADSDIWCSFRYLAMGEKHE